MILSLFFVVGVYLISQLGIEILVEIHATPTILNRMKFSQYENSSFAITMQYPSDWKKIDDFRGSWFRNLNESVNMRVEVIPYGVGSLDDLTSERISLIEQQFPREVLTESNATRIGANYTGHKIVFEFPVEPRNQETKVKEMQVWTINGSRAYIISYFTLDGAYNYYLPIAEKIIESLRVTSTDKK